MNKLLQVSHANVQRPGFMITAESLHLNCPIIFNGIGSIMPQESLAVRYFVPRQMAVKIAQSKQLSEIIKNWLDNPEERIKIYQNIANYDFNHTSFQKIINELIEKVKSE